MPLAPLALAAAARRTAAAVACLAAAAATALPRDAAAQDYRLASGIALSAGAADYDLTGSGTTTIIALRADTELRRWLVGELGASALRPKEALASRLTYVVPEAQLQLQIRAGVLRPYLGAGGGWFYAIGPNRKFQSALSASASAGVRIARPNARFGVQAEVRRRGIDRDFSRRVTEATAGAALRF
jgi:hypothetical protein